MATPTDYILRVYPTEALAIEEDGGSITALKVLGDEVTVTSGNATVVYTGGGTNTIAYTINSGTQSMDLNKMFSVGESVTITGFANSANNVVQYPITAVGTNTMTVTASLAPGVNEGPSSGLTLSFKQASSVRPHIDSNNQGSTYTDENGISQNYNFYTHQRYFYRLDSVTPATEFYIDWDDGDDNTPENANYSLKKFDLPQQVAIFEHTYTKHGQFFPMIKLKNAAGFDSKYYTTCNAPRSSYRELEAKHDLTATQVAGTTEQNLSIVALDSNSAARIPSFIPSNAPPVAVLKTDRSTVFSGIDNTVLTEGLSATNTNLDVKAQCYAYLDRVDLGISHTSGVSGGIYNIDSAVEVVYIDNNDNIRKQTVAASSGTGTNAFPDAVFPNDGTGIKKLISAKLLACKEQPYGDVGLSSKQNASTAGLYPDERIWLRLINSDDLSSGGETTALLNPANKKTLGEAHDCFGFISNGNPFISINDPRTLIQADGSESMARNSNVVIFKYFIYDDKVRLRDKAGTNGSSGAKTSILDAEFAPGVFSTQATDAFGQQVEGVTHPKQTLSYNLDVMRGNQHDNMEFHATGHDGAQLVGVGRLYDDFRLLRLQVQDGAMTSTSSNTVVEDTDGSGARGADTFDRSVIQHDSNYMYNVGNRPAFVKSNGLLCYRNDNGIWSDLNAVNTKTDQINFGGDAASPGNTGSTLRVDLDNVAGDVNVSPPKNWLVMAKSRKFNKVFFRQDNDLPLRSLQTAPQVCRIVAYYSTSSGWKELAIKDDTKVDFDAAIGNATSLHRSGMISWDMPEDWERLAYNGINSGSWGHISPTSTKFITDAGTTTIAGSSGSQTITFAGGAVPNTAFLVGDIVTLSNTATGAGNNKDITITAVSSTAITTSTTLTNESSASITATIKAQGGGATAPLATDPSFLWTTTKWPQIDTDGSGGYGILFGIKSNGATLLMNQHVVACDTPDSRVIRIVDPSHISINAAMIAQSVGFTRRGKYYEIMDRMGKSEIRRLGAEGGRLTFGGVDLGDNSAGKGSRTRERLVEYQKKGTPIYYDIRHKNGKYTRFFGVLNQLSEDIPTGNAPPKFGVNMIVSHLIHMDVNGTMEGDVVSLGGEVESIRSFLND